MYASGQRGSESDKSLSRGRTSLVKITVAEFGLPFVNFAARANAFGRDLKRLSCRNVWQWGSSPEKSRTEKIKLVGISLNENFTQL